MSLVSICNTLCLKVFKQSVSTVQNSTDSNVLQAAQFINEAGQELAARYTWQELTNESSFLTVASEVQGTLASLTGPGFAFILNNVMWNRDQRRPVYGPLSESDWQAVKATFVNGPWNQYRIRQNQVLMTPVPAAGQHIFFEWQSSYWAADFTGSVAASVMALDTDASFLPERVITLDALWRFKRANSFPYDEDYLKAQDAINDLMSRNKVKPMLSLTGGTNDLFPGVWVSAGSWPLS